MLTPPRALASISLLVFAIAACHTGTQDAPAVPSPPLASALRDPGPPAKANRWVPLSAPPSLMIEQLDGADAARARAIFAPVETSLRGCTPGAGTIVVSMRQTDDSTRMSVQPGSSLDAGGKRCALEILSTVDADGVLQRTSPADRPGGFSAQIRINW